MCGEIPGPMSVYIFEFFVFWFVVQGYNTSLSHIRPIQLLDKGQCIRCGCMDHCKEQKRQIQKKNDKLFWNTNRDAYLYLWRQCFYRWYHNVYVCRLHMHCIWMHQLFACISLPFITALLSWTTWNEVSRLLVHGLNVLCRSYAIGCPINFILAYLCTHTHTERNELVIWHAHWIQPHTHLFTMKYQWHNIANNCCNRFKLCKNLTCIENTNYWCGILKSATCYTRGNHRTFSTPDASQTNIKNSRVPPTTENARTMRTSQARKRWWKEKTDFMALSVNVNWWLL